MQDREEQTKIYFICFQTKRLEAIRIVDNTSGEFEQKSEHSSEVIDINFRLLDKTA